MSDSQRTFKASGSSLHTIAIASLFTLLMLLGSLNALTAQSVDLDRFILPIEKAETDYSGQGLDWVLEHASESQFVLFGEQHGISGLAHFVKQVYDSLQDSGFDHLIVENDFTVAPGLMEHGLEAFLAQYPHTIAFDFDADLDLMEHSLRLHPDKQVIWGVDQIISGFHAFSMLESMATSTRSRRLCRGLFLKAALKSGRYMGGSYFGDLDPLKAAFETEENPQALYLIDQLETSMKIYEAYFKARRGETDYLLTNQIREGYMKLNFMKFLESASEVKADVKGVLKMGGSHTVNGVGPNGVRTLGDHIRKVTEAKGKSILSLGIFNRYEAYDFIPEQRWEGKGALLLDLMALKATVLEEPIDLPAALQESMDNYDAVILLNNSPRDSDKRAAPYKASFRKRVIGILIPLAILIIFNLSLLAPLIKWGIQKFKGRSIQRTTLFHGLLFFTGLLINLVAVLQITSVLSGTPFSQAKVLPGTTSAFIFILLFVISVVPVAFIYLKRQKTHLSRAMKWHFRLVAMANMMLVGYMYYWNLGGMLG